VLTCRASARDLRWTERLHGDMTADPLRLFANAWTTAAAPI